MPIDEEEFVHYDPFDPERRSTGTPSPIKRITKVFSSLDLLDPLINYYCRIKPDYSQLRNLGNAGNRKFYEWRYEPRGTTLGPDGIAEVRYANGETEAPPPHSPPYPALVFEPSPRGSSHFPSSARRFPGFNLLEELGVLSPTPEEILDSLLWERQSLLLQVERRLTEEERRVGGVGAEERTHVDAQGVEHVQLRGADELRPEIIFEFTPAGQAFVSAVGQALGAPDFARRYINTFENISNEHLEKGIFSTRQITPTQDGLDIKLSRSTLSVLIGYYIDFTAAHNIQGHRRDAAFIKALKAFYTTEQIPGLNAFEPEFLEPFYKEYEYYDFKTETPFLVDFVSFWAINGLTRASLGQELDVQFTEDAATIKPNYNYYSPEYERALRDVPEAALPNMYVYSFASDRESASAPKWQNSETQESEIKNGYDKIIRIGEFVSGTLPRLNPGTGPSREFRNYLSQYARGVKNAIVDFSSPAAKDYYGARDSLSNDLISPASEMGFYDKLNHRKNMFPMYVEMNIPTLNIGPIGELIERTKTSTSCLNSLITGVSTALSDYPSLDFQTDAIVEPDLVESPGSDAAVLNLYHRGILTQPSFSKIKWSQPTRVHDVDTWLEATQVDINAQVVSEEGQERLAGQCPGLVDRARFQTIRNSIASASRLHLLDWKTILDAYINAPIGGSDPDISCKTETIAYRLVKKHSRNNVVIQNFYFSNTSKEDIIKFVDTQVKPFWAGPQQPEYQYELYAYAIVYGSKFQFRFVDEQLEDILVYEDEGGTGYSPVYSKFGVETFPNPKIVEYPIFTTQQAEHPNEPGPPAYGVSYPPITIDQRPPTPPEMRITPYKGNYRQILLNFETGTGEFIGKDAIPAITLSDEETAGAEREALYQMKFLNYSLKAPELEFSSEGGPDVHAIEVYRTDELPQSPQSRQALYRGFGATPYRVLNMGIPSIPTPPEEEAKAFDFVDTINPNKKYYYTCRSRDTSGLRSNPSEIYEVELVYNDGIYYPIINLYQPPLAPRRKLSRQFIRYLEIKPAEIQTHVETHLDPETQELVSTRGLMTEAVEAKKFLVRITSQDTGRKFDINLSFKKTGPN
tara:strand:- start:2398 stop:5658 length:3261 start_codon:yes stop_codon:yes gene_type:complete